ncbi:helix-turn-helix domain-containing protein [Tepidicaulis sp. LMO-SS28]|uniref:helix-turn-helix domain-containing protein n=1 Tax=Tepidicaulis sp. LMO-SS28 TaxID=3447455 RepID=UPI003EE194F7
MTPFGAKLRFYRERKGLSQADLAAAVGVSAAYLSALEHGRRGRPGFDLVQRLIGQLGIIWDEAEEMMALARLSHPKIVIDTGGLDPRATELANRLARQMRDLDGKTLDQLLDILRAAEKPATPRRRR